MDDSNKDTSARKKMSVKSADFQWKFCLKVLIDHKAHTHTCIRIWCVLEYELFCFNICRQEVVNVNTVQLVPLYTPRVCVCVCPMLKLLLYR